ncbi:hypothetical protein QF046_002120 [Microbacterium sp. W4I4]|nr:hypothetical protein [Microbacterium sp. W4I4]
MQSVASPSLDYAAMYQIQSGMHGPTDISPIGMAAAMHLVLSIHNFGIQEYMKHGAKTDQVFQQSYTWTDGYLHPGDKPGLGVEPDVDEAGKYRTGRPTCRTTACSTALCTTGERAGSVRRPCACGAGARSPRGGPLVQRLHKP